MDTFENNIDVPNPGSKEAVAKGCTCPVLDNGHGRGYMGGVKDGQGRTLFVYRDGCPMHWKATDGQ